MKRERDEMRQGEWKRTVYKKGEDRRTEMADTTTF